MSALRQSIREENVGQKAFIYTALSLWEKFKGLCGGTAVGIAVFYTRIPRTVPSSVGSAIQPSRSRKLRNFEIDLNGSFCHTRGAVRPSLKLPSCSKGGVKHSAHET